MTARSPKRRASNGASCTRDPPVGGTASESVRADDAASGSLGGALSETGRRCMHKSGVDARRQKPAAAGTVENTAAVCRQTHRRASRACVLGSHAECPLFFGFAGASSLADGQPGTGQSGRAAAGRVCSTKVQSRPASLYIRCIYLPCFKKILGGLLQFRPGRVFKQWAP